MLLNGHELNRVITGGCNSGDDVSGKFFKRADLPIFLGHPDVGLINIRRFGRTMEGVRLPLICKFRAPHLGRKQQCFGILNHVNKELKEDRKDIIKQRIGK